MNALQDCIHCQGSGSDWQDYSDCEWCHGTGQLDAYYGELEYDCDEDEVDGPVPGCTCFYCL